MAGEQLKNRHLCALCVGEPFLRSEIEKRGHSKICSYCRCRGKSFSLEEMAAEVEIALKEHFYRTSPDPSDMEYMMIKEGDLDWEREGERIVYVIENYASIESEPAEDIGSILAERHFDFEDVKMGEENPFGSDAQYAERGWTMQNPKLVGDTLNRV
jgi:hypothetical protein